MQVLILGVKPVSFTPKGENQEKRGLSVYYSSESPDVIGLYAGDIWVDAKKLPTLYENLLQYDYKQPVPADFVYDFLPGRKTPALMDIKFLKK